MGTYAEAQQVQNAQQGRMDAPKGLRLLQFRIEESWLLLSTKTSEDALMLS